MLSVSCIGAIRATNAIKTGMAGQNKTQNTHQNTYQNVQNARSSTKLPGYGFYSDITFTNRRTPMTLEEKFERIKPEQFPSERIINNIQAAIEDPENKKSIYDIHMETYAPLLECKTLDEAKAMFPEFENVRDAKDLFLTYGTQKDKEKAFRSAPYLAQRVFEKSVPGVSIEDLSLELLKKIYGKGYAVSAKSEFYGFTNTTTVKTLEALNIKHLDVRYLKLINGDNPEIRQKRKIKTKESWNQDTEAARARREEARRFGHICWDVKTEEEKQAVIRRLYDNNVHVKARKERKEGVRPQEGN